MNTVNQITKKLALVSFGFPGGISIATKNVQRHGDYATVCFLGSVHALADGVVLDIVGSMEKEFKNHSAIKQIKEYILSINKAVRFADEPDAPVVEIDDADLYSKEQLSTAMRRVDSYTETATSEDRLVIQWAVRRGYVISQSYTQKYFTNAGVEWVRS